MRAAAREWGGGGRGTLMTGSLRLTWRRGARTGAGLLGLKGEGASERVGPQRSADAQLCTHGSRMMRALARAQLHARKCVGLNRGIPTIGRSEPMQNDQAHFFNDIFFFYNIIKL